MKEINFDDFYYKGKKYSLTEQKVIYRKSYYLQNKFNYSYLKNVFYFSLLDCPDIIVRMIINFNDSIFYKKNMIKSIKSNFKIDKTKSFISPEFLSCPYLLLAFIKDYSQNHIFECTKYIIEKEEVINFYEDSYNNYKRNSLLNLVSNNDNFELNRDIEEWLISYEDLYSLGE